MLRRSPALLCFAMTFGLFGCKARGTDGSAVKADEEPSASTSNLTFDDVFELFDKDAKILELSQLSSGGVEVDPASPTKMTLTYDDPATEALKLAKKLQEIAKESILAERPQFENLALELEAMSQLLAANMPGADAAKLTEAITRVRAILDAPQVKVKPVAPPVAAVGENDLACIKSAKLTLPQRVKTSKTLGFDVPSPDSDPRSDFECPQSLMYVKNGLVCSISDEGDITPFVIRTGKQLGPKYAFARPINCFKAIEKSTSTEVCIVDNKGGGGAKFSRYEIDTNERSVAVYDTFAQCVSGDKSPSEVRLCLDRVDERLETCRKNADKSTGTELAIALHRVECSQQAIREREACR